MSVAFYTLLLAFGGQAKSAEPLPNPDTAGLPPRSVPAARPARPIPEWVENAQARRPPARLVADGRRVCEGRLQRRDAQPCWGGGEVVGPSADLYPAERVKEAEQYMRTHVERCHAAGAKAVFYMGPVQVPSGNEIFAKAHPDWLRIKADGQADPVPNFANIRSGYADWLLKQLEYVTREFHVDGFWFDGYAPVHLHTYDEATKKAFREFSGGKEIPTKFDPVHDPVAKQYLAWHTAHFVDFADRMRDAIRAGQSPVDHLREPLGESHLVFP